MVNLRYQVRVVKCALVLLAFVIVGVTAGSVRLKGKHAIIKFDDDLSLMHNVSAIQLSGGSFVIAEDLFVQNGAVNVGQALAATQSQISSTANSIASLQSQLDAVVAQQTHNQRTVNVTINALHSQIATLESIVAAFTSADVPHKGDWTFTSPSSTNNTSALDGITNNVLTAWVSTANQSPGADQYFVIDFGRVCNIGGVHLPVVTPAEAGTSLQFRFSTDVTEPGDWSVVPVSVTGSGQPGNYQFNAVFAARWMKVSQVGTAGSLWKFTDVFVTEYPSRASWFGPPQLMDASFASYYNPGTQTAGHSFIVDTGLERRVAGVNFSHRNFAAARSLTIRTATGAHAPIHWHTITPAYSCRIVADAFTPSCPPSTLNYQTTSYRFNTPVLARYIFFEITESDASVWQLRGMFVFSQ